MPPEPDSDFFKKKVIVIGIIGKTQGVKSAAKPEIKAIIKVLKDIKSFKKPNNIILFSPSAASFDQFKNFEDRGDKFKKLSRNYAKKFI